ncbi:unnamed protein product [Durusdinium trenchii]|uniref:C3H1-type domain-containing protein n=1 Tax=Durusdinium trenchii TaxID=1381693 RepID=A0ABP0KZ27_9DINO
MDMSLFPTSKDVRLTKARWREVQRAPTKAIICKEVRGEFATRGRSRWPTSLTSGVVVGVEVEEATIQAEVPEEQLTVGSIGHPVLCRRACVWFAKGMCSHSANCSYCHLPHHANITFDKRQWQQLQQMDLASLLAILLPSLRATLAAADLPREPAAQLLATVEAQAAPTALQHDRMLQRTVRRMSLSAMVFCELLQEHVDHLRHEMTLP